MLYKFLPFFLVATALGDVQLEVDSMKVSGVQKETFSFNIPADATKIKSFHMQIIGDYNGEGVETMLVTFNNYCPIGSGGTNIASFSCSGGAVPLFAEGDIGGSTTTACQTWFTGYDKSGSAVEADFAGHWTAGQALTMYFEARSTVVSCSGGTSSPNSYFRAKLCLETPSGDECGGYTVGNEFSNNPADPQSPDNSPSPSPSPSPPPPSPSPPAGSSGDPHIKLGHGGVTDFRGEDSVFFNFLSSQNMTLNVKTEDSTFKLNKVTVHGSFLTEAHLVMTSLAGKLFHVSFKTSELNQWGWGWHMVNTTCGTVKRTVSMHQAAECDNLRVSVDLSTVHIEADEWRVVLHGMPVPGRISGPHHRIDLDITQKVADHEFAVPPHGIIGQSFDNNPVPRVGKQDKYPPLDTEAEFTTKAMAEGAIEGTADEYKVASPFDTAFKYSVFGLPKVAKRAPGATDMRTAWATM
jgi:hypothetical protein